MISPGPADAAASGSKPHGVWVPVVRATGRVAWRSYTGENSGILVGAMLVTVAIFGVLLRDEGFLSVDNLLNIIRLSATITVMAVATVFVISAGEIDLSIASVVAVAALIAALLMSIHYPFVLAAIVVGSILLSWTALGRKVLATGANRNAARFSGIRTGRIRVGVLVASGAAGALAGLLYDGQFAAAEFTTGSSDLLTVIAAAI